MNYLDIYYRALIDYRKSTGDFRECINQRLSTAKANATSDKLTVTRKICTVETDWVDAIEEGLVHVEKAIREERQFIRSNGEVIDIEKVKGVSKDSVEHLARHSNLITRYEEGEDVIPDRLYTVERLSDYAVYENRFLYMLLCYLRDFITLRYNKILELEHTYNGSMSMNKNIVMTKRNLAFEIKVQEERKDDLYLKKQSESKDIIVRIGNQLKLVLAFLATPLMQEVSKVAMLKPPITKTNVLRMNHNFRGALALYEYISAYDKPGYSVEEKVSTQSPFRLDVADEMAEIVMLASFLTYEHGLNLKSELQLEYEKEEERRKEEEKKRLLEQLKALRHRIRESGESPEEYMLMLEKANRLLQEDRENLQLAKQEIELLKNDILALENDKKQLNEEITRLNNTVEELKEDHEKELNELNEQHRAEIDNINEEHQAELTSVKEDYEAQLTATKEEYEELVAAVKEGYEAQLDSQKNGYESQITSLNEQIATDKAQYEDERKKTEVENARVVESIRAMWQAEVIGLKEVCTEKDDSIEDLKVACQKLEERRMVSDARLTALRKEHGLISPTEDFTTEAAFTEIERQIDVFIKFFKEQWGITKKAIKKQAIADYKAGLRAEKEAKRGKAPQEQAQMPSAPQHTAGGTLAFGAQPVNNNVPVQQAQNAPEQQAPVQQDMPVSAPVQQPQSAEVQDVPIQQMIVNEPVQNVPNEPVENMAVNQQEAMPRAEAEKEPATEAQGTQHTQDKTEE